MAKDSGDYDKPVPQAKLKEALDKELAVLGRPISDLVMDQLQRFGIVFGDREASYNLRQIENALQELLGRDAAVILMEKLHRSLFSEQNKKSETNGHFSFL